MGQINFLKRWNKWSLPWLLLLLLLFRLLLMFATIERMFMEVARKVIWAILTAAASAAVGHLKGRDEDRRDLTTWHLTFVFPPSGRYMTAPASADWTCLLSLLAAATGKCFSRAACRRDFSWEWDCAQWESRGMRHRSRTVFMVSSCPVFTPPILESNSAFTWPSPDECRPHSTTRHYSINPIFSKLMFVESSPHSGFFFFHFVWKKKPKTGTHNGSNGHIIETILLHV